MKNAELKQLVESKECLGYWEKFGGVEVHDIQHTPDGIIFLVKAGVMSESPTYHKRKLLEFGTDGGHRDNIRVYNSRLYIDDCLRVWR